MILKSSNDKLTFIVDTQIAIGLEYKGGSIVLHKLAYELAHRGHFVYVFNQPLYPHENIEIIPTEREPINGGWSSSFRWEQFYYNISRTVTIYTQISFQNKFNTKNNTRWILHHTDEKQWSMFGSDEYVCNYGTFNVPIDNTLPKLTVFDYNLDLFNNRKNENRKGFGHIIHKSTPDWGIDFLQKLGSTEIPIYNGQKKIDYLAEEFNKYEYLLTFDDKTYLTTAAALCGTKSIILNPKKDLLPIEYRDQNPIQQYGVAYGFNDIGWAENTIHLVREHIKGLEVKDQKTIDNLINYWEKRING